jgi:hypothetical protein
MKKNLIRHQVFLWRSGLALPAEAGRLKAHMRNQHFALRAFALN